MGYFMHLDSPAGTPVLEMDSLEDIDLSNPSDGQMLKYNGTTSKWENAGVISTISLTSQEYEALSTAEKTNPLKVYIITDEDGVDEGIIDDTTSSVAKTYSSYKIDEELDSLNGNKAGFIDTTNLITTIDTYNADYTATVDCWCIGFCRKGSSSGNNAQVNLDSINIANVNSLENHIMQFPVKKGQHIKTRNDASGVYTLFVYGMI